MRNLGALALTAVTLAGTVALAPAADAQQTGAVRAIAVLKTYSAKHRTITVEPAQLYMGRRATTFAATHRAYRKYLTCGASGKPYTGKEALGTCSVMDDYLLVQSPKHPRRTLHLNRATRVDLLKTGESTLRRARQRELSAAARGSAVIWVTADQRGSVSRISQQYLP